MKHKYLSIVAMSLLLSSCSIGRITIGGNSNSPIKETTSEPASSEDVSSIENEDSTSESKPSSQSQIIELENVNFKEESLTLIVGETYNLIPLFTPENASNTSGSWMTSSRKVATVNNGTITAVGVGTCRITYTVGDIKAVCNLNVKQDNTTIHVTGITISKNEVTINKGGTVTLTYNLLPSDTTEKNVKWITSNSEIASVENGKIIGLAPGDAIVSVIAEDGNYSANCIVHVKSTEVSKEGYELLWNDEFNGVSLDTSIWDYDVGGDGWGNSELQYYTRGSNVVVSNGTCKIVAKREAFGNRSFTSTRMVTRDKKEFTYGYVEARLKVPAFQGSWPAFWMLGKNIYDGQPWPYCGEIDIMEYANASNTLFGTLHWNANGKNTATPYQHAYYGKTTTVNNMTEYHTYALDWDANSIKILVDDVQFFEGDITPSGLDCFHNDFYILFNLAVGGNFVSEWNVNNIGFVETSQMEIDYVRVFKKTK